MKAFVGLGGNFLRAVPDTDRMEAAWRKLRLTVQIATKPNRSQIVHGAIAYVLPCLGRIEIDRTAGGVEQSVSVEDSTGCIHASRGVIEPASPHARSEPWIVASLARALLPENTRTPWHAWASDYSLVRLAIERTYPDIFRDFEQRRWQPGGFARPLAARQRIWKTDNGKANFIVPSSLDADPDMASPGGDVLRLMTLRSNDQFNTTVYGYDDRFRGVSGTRSVLMMHTDDIARLGLREGDLVVAATVADDAKREVSGLTVTPHDLPRGCAAAYYPECNPLLPLWHHAAQSKVPAAKSIPIRVRKLPAP